ncbi:hypothetical protein [Halobaculum sp. MBLA0143]|uniref:hypothetical protein n=1 Tax=Halobaculum sp. MBLA0143 TaxID=3079933 RepID=UPI0035238556
MNTGLLTALVGGVVGGLVTQSLAHVLGARRSRRDRRRKWCREVQALAKRVESRAKALDATEPVSQDIRSKSPDEAESEAIGRILSDIEELRQKRYSTPVSLDDTEVEQALERLTRPYPREAKMDAPKRTSEFKNELAEEAKRTTDKVEEVYPEPLLQRLSKA